MKSRNYVWSIHMAVNTQQERNTIRLSAMNFKKKNHACLIKISKSWPEKLFINFFFWVGGTLTSLQVYTVILRTRHYHKVRRRVLWCVRPSHAGAWGLVLCRDRPHSVALDKFRKLHLDEWAWWGTNRSRLAEWTDISRYSRYTRQASADLYLITPRPCYVKRHWPDYF